MRLIDADALMETLGITDMDCNKCKWGTGKNIFLCTRGSDFTDACTAIEDAPTIEPEQHWIPCSERLPEKVYSEHANDFIYPTVIICDESGRVTAGFYGEYVDGGSYWYDMDSETEISNIVAWCPLPECYKGES